MLGTKYDDHYLIDTVIHSCAAHILAGPAPRYKEILKSNSKAIDLPRLQNQKAFSSAWYQGFASDDACYEISLVSLSAGRSRAVLQTSLPDYICSLFNDPYRQQAFTGS